MINFRWQMSRIWTPKQPDVSDKRGRRAALAQIKTLASEDGREAASQLVTTYSRSLSGSLSDRVFRAQMFLNSGQPEKALAQIRSGDDLSIAAQKILDEAYWLSITPEYLRGIRGGAALGQVLQLNGIESVLDVGSGGGQHADLLAEGGKYVTCVDLGKSVYFSQTGGPRNPNINVVLADFLCWDTDRSYDLVWASHILEHQVNPNAFIKKCLQLTAPGGFLAITVPPLKHNIVGGHVGLWNAGLLLYQLILAGNDCSSCVVMNYGYNVSIIVRKKPVELPDLSFDAGDIDILAKFFPSGCSEPFDGRMYGRRTTAVEL